MNKETTVIEIQDKYHSFIKHVYTFEGYGKCLNIWYNQKIDSVIRKVVSINGYREYYNQAKAEYKKA
tara:strand:+ start:2242 stop:2442 length:201 start_codon:yes stop_codon:yes gene_type:complete